MKIDIVDAWYRGKPWLLVLRPLSWLFGFIVNRKRQAFLQNPSSFPVPVIIVGNITVGGTGKTPVVQAVVNHLIAMGKSPVVVSRGYGGRVEPENLPLSVTANSDPAVAGDEPVMLAASLACPIVVDPKRISAALYAIQEFDCDVIVSDDGLQHYQLPRHYEIAIVDGQRGLGNRKLLPEGPLREPVDRLLSVDSVLVNGSTTDDMLSACYQYDVEPIEFVQVASGETVAINSWHSGSGDVAVAAIGNPHRFSQTLAGLDIHIPMYAFADHHQIQPTDLPKAERILMTEKDAIKCRHFNDDRLWYLRIRVALPSMLKHDINNLFTT